MTHAPVGVVSVDVLLGLVVFIAWHGILMRPALAAAPAGLRGRICSGAVHGLRTRLSTLGRLLLVLVSLSIGAATHVVWDSFTHAGGWGTTHLHWLTQQNGPLAGYGWAQYASGMFGALVVTRWLALWWYRTPIAPAASELRPQFAALAWLSVFCGWSGWRSLWEPGSADFFRRPRSRRRCISGRHQRDRLGRFGRLPARGVLAPRYPIPSSRSERDQPVAVMGLKAGAVDQLARPLDESRGPAGVRRQAGAIPHPRT